MREPLFTARNAAAQRHFIEGDTESYERTTLAAAWHRATELAVESAFSHGIDFPVGAVALDGAEVAGRGYAGDRRLRHSILHAEVMAMVDVRFDALSARADTMVVTVEPCSSCQDALATMPGLKKVAFGLSRGDLVERGLVREHSENIFERLTRVRLPYEVVQIEDDQLREDNLLIIDHVNRDIESGEVRVDTEGLKKALKINLG